MPALVSRKKKKRAPVKRAGARAEKMYKDFYALNPKTRIRLKIPELEKGIKTLVCLGTAERIDYVSDKWDRPKKSIYQHDFVKDWYLCTNDKGTLLILIPKRYGKRIVKPEGIID